MDFIRCGLFGWCMEVLWTGMASVKNRDAKCMGNTSLPMFPIYGMASFFRPLSRKLEGRPVFLRGTVYAACIFTVEYVSGKFLKKHDMCPWDYTGSRCNIEGLVRLDYAPCWFSLGLMYEKMLQNSYYSRKSRESR